MFLFELRRDSLNMLDVGLMIAEKSHTRIALCVDMIHVQIDVKSEVFIQVIDVLIHPVSRSIQPLFLASPGAEVNGVFWGAELAFDESELSSHFEHGRRAGGVVDRSWAHVDGVVMGPDDDQLFRFTLDYPAWNLDRSFSCIFDEGEEFEPTILVDYIVNNRLTNTFADHDESQVDWNVFNF